MADEALSAGAVARRLGVAVTTLRTWHQRYGLGPSEHVPGHHRRYTPADLARLEIMRRLTAQGVTPAEAARWAGRTLDAVPTDTGVRPRVSTADGRDGGGSTIPVGRAGPAARGLARAAMRLDPVAIGETIARAVQANGVVATWDGLLRPVLFGIGERHAATGALVEVEHLMSRCVSEAFAVAVRTGMPAGPPRILLTCADEEQHTLPLEALAAALAEAGVGCRMLGARVPLPALLDAVNRTGPAAVVIWSHTRVTADAAQLNALLAAPHRPLLVLAAGPGWLADSLPAGVVRPVDLTEAVSLALAVRDSLDQVTPD
ncbi:MerR family transcriptional regulator [Micromonospora peucetia]|uniref:B12 binding domain-containing protein n=1 Tax=Micromonospora peucetia TaxID=47871 RepID=A0A1C6US83_9ACTN|nr:MerR family transcriptional regulator [Micromonospora peucetia]MCX4387417.1 MerR family transcriptional regulator [Micromonospora peucetia]WSA34743.1 MerR family transcriptional regulator [Micromonospora peucetia]SCL56974.1 B12 binding domain-containing protein [Micromonospora peucetia]